MKKVQKILALMLMMAISLTCIGINTFAAPTDDLSVDNFELSFSIEGNSLTVNLNCNKAVTAWGAGSGTMSITDNAGADATEYFTLTSVTTLIGDDNSDENGAKWSTTANDVDEGDSIVAGTWATYVYTVAEDVPVGDYSFTMQFIDGDCYEGKDMDDYSCSGQSISGTYTVSDDSILSLSAPTNSDTVMSGDIIRLELKVNQAFNCAEIHIEYTDNLVAYYSGPSVGENEVLRVDTETPGVLKLIHLGAAKGGTDAYTYAINFRAETAGDASFEVTSAKFGSGENIEAGDAVPLPESDLPDPYSIKVITGHSVSLDTNVFTSTCGSVVLPESTYTFKLKDNLSQHYNYSLASITMNGTELVLGTDYTYSEESGEWTILSVTGPVVITGQSEGKEYSVEWIDTASIFDVSEKPSKLTHGADFSIQLPEDETGFKNGISATIDGVSVGYYNSTTRVFTIYGADITDTIVITVTQTAVQPENVTITIAGDSGVSFKDHATNSLIVPEGTAVTLVLTPVFGYRYSVVVGSGSPVTFENNEYTFTADSSLTVSVTKTVEQIDSVEVTEYLKLRGTSPMSMWLVTIGSEKVLNGDQKYAFTYTLGGETVEMSWSEKYGAYAALIIAATNPTNSLTYQLVTVNDIQEINYDLNVNGSAKTDINDAQLVWNMYNQLYNGVTEKVTIDKFWKADVHANRRIDVSDALAIVTAILDGTAQ